MDETGKKKTRVILFTGKGGVGKTTISAATAAHCAELGYRTLSLSTDAAHSLQDSFDASIGFEPTKIMENLYGQEIDVTQQIVKNWGPIHQFFQKFLQNRGFGNVVAEELAIFPGMEEIFNLLEVLNHYESGLYDVIVIDCAPTSDTARLLTIPDIFKWYMEKFFNIERQVMKAVRPVAKRLMEIPLPEDEVFQNIEMLYGKVIGMKELLLNGDVTSMRVVFNLEKMVIKETQRTYAFLNLFNFPIDAVIANRVLPHEIRDPYYGKWKEIQCENMGLAEESFSPLPIMSCKLWDREVVGIPMLARVGREIYGAEDPTRIFYQGKVVEISENQGEYELLFHLPTARKEDMELFIHGDELVVKFRNFRRNLVLPRKLVSAKLLEATFKEQTLSIRFGRQKDEPRPKRSNLPDMSPEDPHGI
ncbi:MAG: ArsA family ATPase [Deltaproteobacteria bacterium]|nr:ArsA family ATPase [Deltaproteobacteria bacterium]MBW2306136.1 ArsA family ATPase [Deltaproteobacteria bacterium]